MKTTILVPLVSSVVITGFMLLPDFGFSGMINGITGLLDYTLIWSLGPIEITLVAITPWIAFGLLRSAGQLTVKNEVSLSFVFFVGIIVSFIFGFLVIDIEEADLLNGFLKRQPFASYWAIWFASSNFVIGLLYFLRNKLVIRNENEE
jgi:hypothetical protein